MKLYSLYTKTHEVLAKQWFMSSLNDEFDLHMKMVSNVRGGDYGTEAFGSAVLEKSNYIISAIQENMGEVFIYSDVDIQFFKPVQSELIKAIEGYDIVCQKDGPRNKGELCTGFFVIKANQQTLRLWELVRECVQKEGRDQIAFNRIVRRLRYLPFRYLYSCPRIKYNYLPLYFFGGGALTGKQWFPGIELSIPDNIVLHHANWTVGIKNKIAQLEYVRDVVMSRNEKG